MASINFSIIKQDFVIRVLFDPSDVRFYIYPLSSAYPEDTPNRENFQSGSDFFCFFASLPFSFEFSYRGTRSRILRFIQEGHS